jgi:ADP-dependent NAD(P)H-hydrate dehydratase
MKMKIKTYNQKKARRDLPKRKINDNKTKGGKVAIVAGSPGLWGAALLAAQAASRSGAGYVYCLAQASKKIQKNPDFLTVSLAQLKKLQFDSCVLGPGFRRPQQISALIKHWLKQKQLNVVLDAEALNWLAQHKVTSLPSDWILTPHEGEMARLLKTTSHKVRQNREGAALAAHKKYGGIVLLKGHESLVTDGKGLYKIKSGNPALAKAGSGDVLAGMIAAFLAQKTSQQTPLQMVCLATFIHGAIADQWLKEGQDVLSLRPVDLIANLPKTLANLRKGK